MVFSWWVLLPSGRMQSARYKLRHSPAMHVFGTIRLLHCGCPGLEWWDNWHRTPPNFSLKAIVSGEDFHGKPTLSAAVHLRIWICFIHSAIAKSLCNCPLGCGAPPVFFAMAGNFFWNLGEIMGKYRKVWDIPELARRCGWENHRTKWHQRVALVISPDFSSSFERYARVLHGFTLLRRTVDFSRFPVVF